MLLIASLGIVIFVAMLLTQRNTERAVMRALGLARRQLRSIFLGEAAIVATVSVVVGTLIGVPMAYMFVQVLRRIFVVPPTLSVPPSLALLLLGLLVGHGGRVGGHPVGVGPPAEARRAAPDGMTMGRSWSRVRWSDDEDIND